MQQINENERFLVVKDSREKAGHGWWFQEDDYCKGTVVEKLDTCDYSVRNYETEIGIERKLSTAELAINVTEKRFEKELQRMEDFEYPFIVCEFNYDDIEIFPINSGIPKHLYHKVRTTGKFLLSSITRYMIEYKVKIIFAGKNGDKVVYNLFKHFMRNKVKQAKK